MNDRRHVLTACIYDADRILLDFVNDTAQEENIPVREQLDFHAFLESKVFFILFCHRLRLPMRYVSASILSFFAGFCNQETPF